MRLPAGTFLDETSIHWVQLAVRWILDNPPPAARPRHLNELRALDLEWSATLGISPHTRFDREPKPSEPGTGSANIHGGMKRTTTETTNVERAADAIGCTPQHVRRLAAAGAFPGASRLGGGTRGPWLIPTASIHLYRRTRTT